MLGIIKMASHSVAFGFFCVLDGVRQIDDGDNPGKLVLNYEKNGQTIPLNDPDKGNLLHDIYNIEENMQY